MNPIDASPDSGSTPTSDTVLTGKPERQRFNLKDDFVVSLA